MSFLDSIFGSRESEAVWTVAGLGNPGEKYEQTRHNLGFMVIDELARRAQATIKRQECSALVGRAVVEGVRVDLVKPQTFMNLSGDSIACLLKKSERDIDRCIVIVDDLALPFGKIRVRKSGSAGGHNGLKSIIAKTGTQEFGRLRIGIAPDHPVSDTKKFVLDRFPGSLSEELEDLIKRSADAVTAVVTDGYGEAMSQFN